MNFNFIPCFAICVLQFWFLLYFVHHLLVQLSDDSKDLPDCEAGFSWKSDVDFDGSSISKDAFSHKRVFEVSGYGRIL